VNYWDLMSGLLFYFYKSSFHIQGGCLYLAQTSVVFFCLLF
jgi:hypothetical protein